MKEVPKRLKPKTETIKFLLLRSGNQCAFPECDHPIFNSNDQLVAQCCHIEAAMSDGGQRFNEFSSNERRRDRSNLLFLCHDHHIVTNDVNVYTTPVMRKIKADHEKKFEGDTFPPSVDMIEKVEVSLVRIQEITEETLIRTRNIESLLVKEGQTEKLIIPTKTEQQFAYQYFISRSIIPVQQETNNERRERTLLDTVKEGNDKKIVVLSYAGGGKSTELAHLHHLLSKNDSDFFPVKIDLGNNDVKQGGITGFLDNIYPYWQQLNQELAILIDGLDEVTEDDADDVRKQIITLGELKPQSSIVIMCRNNQYLIEKKQMDGTLKGFSSYHLPPFSDQEVDQYLELRQFSYEEKHHFLVGLDQAGFGQDKFIPFYLVNLVEYYFDKKRTLPTSKIDLFDRLIKSTKEREKRKSPIRKKAINKVESDLDKAIEQTAFVFQCTDKNFLVEQELRKLITEEDLLSVVQRCYVLDHGGMEKWQFEHNNFKEYLCAKFLATQDFAFLARVLFVPEIRKIKPRWLNTLGFLISILSEGDQKKSLVDYLKQNDPESLIRIERDKLDLSIREEVFIEVFEDCVNKNIQPRSPKFSTDNLSYFAADSRRVAEWLIDQIDPKNSKIRINLCLQLLVRNDHWPSKYSEIEALIIVILFNEDVDVTIKRNCLEALVWFQMTDKELINELLSKLNLKADKLEEGVNHLIRQSPFLEDYFPYIWDFFIKKQKFTTSIKFTILIKLNKVDSFSYIFNEYLNSGSRRQSQFSLMLDVIDVIAKKKIYSKSLNDHVYEFFKKNLQYHLTRGGLEEPLRNYLEYGNLKNEYIERLIDDFFQKDIEGSIGGIACLLDHSIVDRLIRVIESSEKTNEQLKTLRNLLRWSKNQDAFDYFYAELNRIKKNQLRWPDYYCFTDKDRVNARVNLLLDKESFIKSSKQFFDNAPENVITWEVLHVEYEENWAYPECNAAMTLLESLYDKFPLSRNQFLNFVRTQADWEFFVVNELWQIINLNANDVLLNDQMKIFLVDWAKNVIRSEGFKDTLHKYEEGNSFYQDKVFFAGFFAQYYHLKLERQEYISLLKIDCHSIRYFSDSIDSQSNMREEEKIENSPLLQYIEKALGKDVLLNEVVKNLKSGDLCEDVCHFHHRFLKTQKSKENRELLLKGVVVDEYKSKSLVWYVELEGSLMKVIDHLEKLKFYYQKEVIEAVIVKDRKILISYLLDKLEQTAKLEDQSTLISLLLKCKAEIALHKMRDWIIKRKDFSSGSWGEYARKIDSPNQIEIFKEIYFDSIKNDFGGDQAFNDRRSFLDGLLELGKKNYDNYKTVEEFLKMLASDFQDMNFLYSVIDNFEFDYYNEQSKSIDLDEAIQLLKN